MNPEPISSSFDIELSDKEASLLLRILACLMILAGASLLIAQQRAGEAMRPGPFAITAGGLAMFWFVHRKRFSLAAWTLCISVIASAAGGALVLRGLNNMGWIAVPVVVMIGAWTLGRQAGNILVVLSVAIVGVFYWMHFTGIGFIETPSPAAAAATIVTAIIAAGVIGRVMSLRILTVLQTVRESQAELMAIVNSTADLIWSVEPEHFTLRSYNDRFAEFFGHPNSGQLTTGQSPQDLFPENRLARDWRDMHRRALLSGNYTLEWSSPDAATELELRFNVMRRQGVVFGVSVFAKDITEQKRIRQQVEFLAYRDRLTRLPNRVLGIDRLEHGVTLAKRHDMRLAVLFLDLNEFKRVNETYGHEFGDEVLKKVASRLQTHLRGQDTLCRLSGNVFMIVLPDFSAEGHLTNVCERILDGLAKPMTLKGNQLVCTASLGIAIYPDDGIDRETLMRNAEIALFEAKKLGHGGMLFYEARMNENVARYVQIRDDLRLAIERGEFELHYQPQVDVVRKEVVGLEALLRWNHPTKGLVMPGDFVSIAEESGLIVPIGAWVLGEACKQAAALHSAGWPQLIMAVNLSAVQFRLGDIQGDVERALCASAMDPTRLELELTESTLVSSADSFTEFTTRWKDRGIRISIDDFGTGYSSMAYLKRFKVDKFKIDRSFIVDIEQDPEDRAIVQAMIQIADNLGLDVTAEGVETAEVENRLVQMGCRQIQGYLIARPLPQEQVADWIRTYDQQARA